MVDKCLLSIDWDYFIGTVQKNLVSLIENDNNIINLWYKRYFKARRDGRDIKKTFYLYSEVDDFWNKVRNKFHWNKDIKVYVSDSHTFSFSIAKENSCASVYLFDAHADLGYGGLASLEFELNCANWLGKLLKERAIHEADIIYSPFTAEKPENFKEINNAFSVKYLTWDTLPEGIEVGTIHICRSGAWTPPWYDDRFFEFVENAGLSINNIDCKPRKWNTKNINLSEQITYMMM